MDIDVTEFIEANLSAVFKRIKNCKFWNPNMDILLHWCNYFYTLEECGAGGLLHILLDDDNYDTESILFCIDECRSHPEREESELGILICEEYLKLSIPERIVFDNYLNGRDITCLDKDRCDGCELIYDWLNEY